GSRGARAARRVSGAWVSALPGVDPETLQAAVDAFLAVDRAEVTRTFKTGPRTFDTREAVLDMRVVDPASVTQAVPDAVPAGEAGCAIIRMVVRHTTPAVRPDDILSALRAVADLVPPAPPLVTRLAQGPLLHDL